MPAQSSSKRKQPASGGGRTANSEPRVQTFTQFGGCNFQLSPKSFEYSDIRDEAQSDLQMNFVVIQNNAEITANKTIETRQPLQKLVSAPDDESFNGVATIIGSDLYLADSTGNVLYNRLGTEALGKVKVNDVDGSVDTQSWTCLGYAGDMLVGLSGGHQLWTGLAGSYTLENAKAVPNPGKLQFSQLRAGGSLAISETYTDECCFRVGLQYTYVNKYGPTLPSTQLTFFASKPTTEWSGSAYVSISSTAPTGYAIKAVELYYVEDEYQDPSFLDRVEMAAGDGGSWSYNWTGYLADTSMWTTANLTLPTENYTAGVPASYMTQHDGRLYFWGGESPERLWIGGNPGNIFSVSTGVGGGYVDVEPGSGQAIRMVPKYKTQSGNSIVTILCDNPNSSHEHRHNLLENNITLSSEQSVKGWQTEKVNGTVGCKSYHGAGVWADGLYAVSRYGLALTTMTMEYNSQLRVQYVSDPIEPVFLDQYGTQLSASVLTCINDVLYLCFGKDSGETEGELDNVIFCYDIDLKAWWTYTLDIDEPILNMLNIDYEGHQEGIGIITPNAVYFLPTTRIADPMDKAEVDMLIETGELATTQPMQSMQHLTQLEFRFDYFVGDVDVVLTCIDQFGRKLETIKHIRHDDVQYNLREYMRVDLVVESYKLVFKGKAAFRMTHFMAKTYPKPSRVGIVWGFDSSQGHKNNTDIHRYFKSYNDLKRAIIP